MIKSKNETKPLIKVTSISSSIYFIVGLVVSLWQRFTCASAAIFFLIFLNLRSINTLVSTKSKETDVSTPHPPMHSSLIHCRTCKPSLGQIIQLIWFQICKFFSTGYQSEFDFPLLKTILFISCFIGLTLLFWFVLYHYILPSSVKHSFFNVSNQGS